MTTTYTLSDLSRRTGRSKHTIKRLIDAGKLPAETGPTGRKEWRITHEAATEAGLNFVTADPQGTVDEALEQIIRRALDPVLVELAAGREASEAAARLHADLLHAIHQEVRERPPPPTGGRRFGLLVRRVQRWAGKRGT